MRDKALQIIRDEILHQHLGEALSAMENYVLMHTMTADDYEAFQSIKEDFLLMTDYWKKGYDDPMRPALYKKLLRRLYVLTANLDIRFRLNDNPYLKALYDAPRQTSYDWSAPAIRHELEDFVSNIAMLELEPQNVRATRSRELYEKHSQYMSWLFDYILTSPLWNKSAADTFTDMLLVPTVESIDQQLIVSAVMLSAFEIFDYHKFRVLINVYRQTTDEPLRQRALVGWTLCLDSMMALLYDEMPSMVSELCDDERCRNELTELQKQLYYCLDAEEDTQKIQKEIFPDLMKGNNMKITRHGLVEMDEDKLEEILHPDVEEEKLERMEESMRRMVDMQKKGSDIYFGGFSQMKRYPFFSEMGNWFLPYYPQHPAVSKIFANARGKKFLSIITRVGAFCDSDKYSFVMAYDQVMERIPDSILKLIDEGEATPSMIGGDLTAEEQKNPAFIRRMYLQNLYRFYRLFHSRGIFRNLFRTDVPPDYLIFSKPLFNNTALQSQYMKVVAFLLKRHLNEEAVMVLSNGNGIEHDFTYYMTVGTLVQNGYMGEEDQSQKYFMEALKMEPENERALVCYARALFKADDYESALQTFRKLEQIAPQNSKYQLNTAICLTRLLRCEEALKILYRLNYEEPNDMRVLRALAWTLTLDGKYDQAIKFYDKLTQREGTEEQEDLLNAGICLWLSRQVEDALLLFHRYVKARDDGQKQLDEELTKNNQELLKQGGITAIDIRLMLDSVKN